MPGVKSFDSYMLLLPDGTAGHGADLDHLRRAAELEAMEGWLVGLRDQRPANEAPRPRRPVVVVTPLGAVGAPVGSLAVALEAASTREGTDYLISALDTLARS